MNLISTILGYFYASFLALASFVIGMESLTTLLNKNLDVSDLTSVQSTIATIEKYMNNISNQVEESISEQYSDVSVVVKETDTAYQKAKQYIDEFHEINAQINKHLDVEIISSDDTQKALMNGMLKSESMISILHQVCLLHDTLEQTSESLDVLEEAEKLKIAEMKLKELCNRKRTPAIVSEMLDRVKDRLLEIFKSATDWSDTIAIQDGSISYSLETAHILYSKINILHVIASSEIATIAELMAVKVYKEILTKILVENMTVKAVENNMKIEVCTTTKVNRIADLAKIFGILNNEILPTNTSFREIFWTVIIEELVPEIKTVIMSEIPESLSYLVGFADQYIPAIDDFEQCIREFKPDFGYCFSSYVSNYHLLFAQKFKEKSYNEARKILMSNSYVTVPVTDLLHKFDSKSLDVSPPRDPCSPLTLSYPKTESILRLPEFAVSQKVADLAKLICSILHEATSKTLSLEASMCLCQTSKNIAELFVIPSFDPFDEEENPKKSAIFFCDCWYLSHVLFWRANELNQDFSNEIFFDVVSLIRIKGASTLKNNENSLLLKVITLLKQMGGLDGQNKENHGMVIEMAFVQIIALIIQYTSEWNKILPQQKYLTILSTTINNTLDLISSETLIIPDISAKHSTCLSNNFNLLLDQLSKVRGDDLTEDSESWVRFKCIISIMDDSLVTIVDNWENGTLSKYFKSSEIQHLTRALFQNTDKNAALRGRIKDNFL